MKRLSFSRRNFFIFVSFMVLTIFVCFYKTSVFPYICIPCFCDPASVKRTIGNPPQLTDSELRILEYYSTPGNDNEEILADQLSRIVRDQIDTIQSPTSCDSPNILCGHFNLCGFGCQVHHRVACLMISYALNLPLIHDEVQGWPYSKKWSHLFKPLGSPCVPGNNTLRWTWKEPYLLCRTPPCLISSNISDQIEYPLKEGLPVAKTLADLVEKTHPDPFLWWVGQFMKFALRPNTYFQNKMDNHRKAIGISHPITGYLLTIARFHVRRTDKILEDNSSRHEIDEYFTAQIHDFNISHSRNVFIASDDSKVLGEAKRKYLDWTVKGFFAKRTLRSGFERADAFEEIARDLLILSECDFIVCGFTSNICRLLYELLNSKYRDGRLRLSSLDGTYEYTLYGHTITDPVVIKIE